MLNFLWGILGLCCAAAAIRQLKPEMEARSQRCRELLHARLVIPAVGNRPRQVLPLCAGHYTIGRRTRRCDIVLKGDAAVSKIHATVWYDGGGFCICPILHRQWRQPPYESPVVVNRVDVPQTGIRLRHGDEIVIGRTTLIFQEEVGP